MIRLYTCLLLWLGMSFLLAQNPFPSRGVVFQDDEVPRVDILIPPASINTILQAGNEDSDEEFAATFIFTDSEMADTVTNVGFRLRGNTSRRSAKKSFKVSFNTFESGRDWHGLEKLNLNGEHNDPSVSRAKTGWALLKDLEVPGARANHVTLYINGEYKGLYANIEHIDEEFVERRFANKDGNLYKCLYPADLAYLGDDPEAYKFASNGRRAYELQTNKEADDYSDLAHFIQVLNQTALADLPCALEAVFHVDSYLRSMAFDVLSGNWDGYWNQNNYYLYHNTATDKFEYIPYDLDNTFGIEWGSRDWAERQIYSWISQSNDRPLFERLLEIPDYRARYTYYLRTVLAADFSPEVLFPQLDELRDLLQPYISNDTYYPRDYGFTPQNFLDAFDGETDFHHTRYGLKSFITARRTTALNQLEDLNPAPYLYAERSNFPRVGEQLAFQVKVQEDEALTEVLLCYRLAGQAETCVAMYDDGNFGDGLADDGEYGIFLPAVPDSRSVSWYVRASDNEGASNRLPYCDYFQTDITAGGLSLAINEFMASNDATIADEEGEYDDWVELHNYGSESIELGGRYLSDDQSNPTKWAFPDMRIAAGEFLLIWTDDDEGQGPLHTSFKLDADGEFIGIFDSDENGNSLIDGTDFGTQETDRALGRLPNGTGAIQAVRPTPGESNQPVSLSEIEQQSLAFTIYPNPTARHLHLEAPHTGHFQAYLTSLQGKHIATYSWAGSQLDIELELPSGTYMLYIEEQGSRVFVTKVVKGH